MISEAPISPRQRTPLRNTSNARRPDGLRKLSGRVRRGQCHLQGRTVTLEVELQCLTTTDETTDRAAQSVLVCLEPVTDAGLHDSLTVFELRHQHEQRVEIVGVQGIRANRDDAAEEQRTEPGRWVDRQHPMTESDAPSRRVHATVEHLELGQDHVLKLLARSARRLPPHTAARACRGRAVLHIVV